MSEGSGLASQKRFTPKERTRTAAPLDRVRVVQELRRFLDLAVREMGLTAKYEISEAQEPLPAQKDGGSPATSEDVGNVQQSENPVARQEADIVVRFNGDEEILLSRNGELLLALEYLVHRCLRLEPDLHNHVQFDCGDYRSARLEELKLSARVAAQRVRETGQPFRFNPMSSRDRRTIHLELNAAPGVRTLSEGSGDRRHLVIYPAAKKPSTEAPRHRP